MAISSRFDPVSLSQGQRTKAQLQETQDSFATTNGVGGQANQKNLSRTSGNRMAFDRARNELLKSNPEEDAAQIEWMKAFSYSPESESWNIAKTSGTNPYLNSGEGDDPGPESEAELSTVEDEGGMA